MNHMPLLYFGPRPIEIGPRSAEITPNAMTTGKPKTGRWKK
jgi:hypothetical protein